LASGTLSESVASWVSACFFRAVFGAKANQILSRSLRKGISMTNGMWRDSQQILVVLLVCI